MAKSEKILTPKTLIMVIFFIIIVPMLPLIISWQWDWWEAWVYAAVSIFCFVISRYLAGRKDPGLIVERGKFLQHQTPEPWDKILSPLLGLAGGLIPLTAGLDARFGTSPEFGLGLKILAIALLLLGYVIGSYALIANKFFSGMVRIQAERGHHVIDTGPYRWVRHPGYLGALITYPVIPLLLESWWTFIPVIFTIIIIVLRTKKEDDALQEKLEGYREYAQQVRYRLIPGVW
jgi:protein-S-isoprenylcysteine O-methyltransferase Ste14